VCEPCPAGTYGDEVGLLECKPAPAGYYLAGEGATSAADVTACAPGTYSDVEGTGDVSQLRRRDVFKCVGEYWLYRLPCGYVLG
jgi:hypothetical protein